MDYRVPISAEKLTVAVTNKGYLYLGSLDGEHNGAMRVEQALLRLAYEESAKGMRRVHLTLYSPYRESKHFVMPMKYHTT